MPVDESLFFFYIITIVFLLGDVAVIFYTICLTLACTYIYWTPNETLQSSFLIYFNNCN